jgi:hypothetical protein
LKSIYDGDNQLPPEARYYEARYYETESLGIKPETFLDNEASIGNKAHIDLRAGAGSTRA